MDGLATPLLFQGFVTFQAGRGGLSGFPLTQSGNVKPLALLTQTQNSTGNVNLYISVCGGLYLQCVLCKITNNTVVSFRGVQGYYVICKVFCWVLHLVSQMLKVSIFRSEKSTVITHVSQGLFHQNFDIWCPVCGQNF